ncbi:DUF4935 domain-containing protein [Mesorhizobium sp. AR10]|uniref:PIN domain-containing protein n=1 Tax=Mesorhizobium sp. AR10 TaxID=2865839 RepID=UPI00215FC422|nr:PIN domain-containing protein [Mesorhizobium sp. AR10]UVK40149.1 DUF4935 domain-containing protein [Mesorhizobium sp. AR10]
MIHILIDTCVWLDMAKDYRQQTILHALRELVEQEEIALIVPRIVVEEFSRNKQRVTDDSKRNLSSVFRRVREAVDQFSDDAKKAETLSQLHEIDHKIITLSDAGNEDVGLIEKLFERSDIIETSDLVKIAASERGLEQRAPFHRQKNSIADAMIIEVYAEHLKQIASNKHAFITHNFKDFGDPTGDNRLPHPDIANMFADENSTYSTRLGEFLNEIASELLEDVKFELEWMEEPRRLSEIIESIDLLTDQVWYNRHWNRRVRVDSGKIKLLPRAEYDKAKNKSKVILDTIWEGALKAATMVEEKHDPDNLGPWSDFEWGMVNGKLSALRWVLGDDWDMLDT